MEIDKEKSTFECIAFKDGIKKDLFDNDYFQDIIKQKNQLNKHLKFQENL